VLLKWEQSINNTTAVGYAASVNSSNLVQLGNTSAALVNTWLLELKLGASKPPDGAANQVLTTNGSGTNSMDYCLQRIKQYFC
jgi:hypothetical protein